MVPHDQMPGLIALLVCFPERPHGASGIDSLDKHWTRIEVIIGCWQVPAATFQCIVNLRPPISFEVMVAQNGIKGDIQPVHGFKFFIQLGV